MKRISALFLIVLIVICFFWQFLIKGLLPIPSDTIVGLYYPFRDFYAKDYPRGIPFKNFLITDPIRQQYPWKNLAIDAEKKLNIPLWNPYNFSGTPLFANLQSGAFYPLNFLFFLFSFPISWSLLIFSQPLLMGVFLFLYLENLKLDRKASFLGAITFAFCGFSISWMEWGNIISTALWLPLLLLSADKITGLLGNKKKLIAWSLVYLFSLLFSFLAGHLQIFFYLFLLSFIYFAASIYRKKQFKKSIPVLVGIYSFFILISSVVWIPLMQFILLSARSVDQINWTQIDWFIPWQNLIQFLAPDFFGNPATLNYFGVWNYGEFIGYIGIGSLILSLYALIFRRDKKTLFFVLVLLTSLIFAFPNIISRLPYQLSVPFISSSQPTRLMFLIDFALSVLAALGLDFFLQTKNKKNIFLVISFFVIAFIGLWVFIFGNGFGTISSADVLVSKRNLILPTVLFLVFLFIFLFIFFFPSKNKNDKILINYAVYFMILILIIDLFRLGWKYMTFANPNYLFPQTKTISFLQKNLGNFRIMETDAQIFPPNFSIMYKLQSIDGYDPLYLQRYAELMATIGRGKPDITPPFGFNRIITPENFKSDLINLLGVKYILSKEDINEYTFVKVFQEGFTKVYENKNVIDRAFFIERTMNETNKQEEINAIYSNNPLGLNAVVSSQDNSFSRTWGVGKASINEYTENKVSINTSNEGEGFLILTDSFYPTWHATIDGKETKIYLTDYNFRGIIVPKGEHKVIFYDTLF